MNTTESRLSTDTITCVARELQEAGRFMVANDLTWGNAGNVSARLDDAHYLITASGARLGELVDDDFVVVPIDPATPAPPASRKPSKECPMHAAVYQERPEINAVLHGASFYATLVSCSDASLPSGLYVEDMYYLERVARVQYEHPGSIALGEGVRMAARGHNVLLLENHGTLAFDTNVKETLQALQVLEMTCRMVITARGAGFSLHSLPERTVNEFLTLSGYRPRREWRD